MAEDKEKKPNGDPYASWRKSIRDTLKWYVAGLAAFGTLLLGGLSFQILPDLQGRDQYWVIAAGLVAIVLVLRAFWRIQGTLYIKPFARERLENEDVQDRLEPYLGTLLLTAGAVTSLQKGKERECLNDLIRMRDEARLKSPPDIPTLVNVETFLAPAASFAAYQELEENTDALNRSLIGLFLAVAVIAMGITAFWGMKKTPAQPEASAALFSPGAGGWADYATELAKACGGAVTFPVKEVKDKPFEGWSTVTFEGPDCKGVTLAVPGTTLQASSSESQ